jgi:serine/threonine-protein kinase
MGAVYRAVEEPGGRPVALKVILAEMVRKENLLARFKREARAAQAVDHPNVVRVIDSGFDNGLPWIAYELCEGGNLSEHLRARGSLEWREAARIAASVARGLAAVHALGLVHRDIKPANILMDRGVPRIADFGLVRGGREVLGASVANLTKTGDAIGTPTYMSPEQIDGDKAIDGRTDLYALGCLLEELLTGSPPFAGAPVEVARKHITNVPPRPSSRGAELPRALDDLVLKLLAKEASGRPASAAETATALEEILAAGGAGSGSGAKVAIFAALAVVVAAGLGAWVALGRTKTEPPASPPTAPPTAPPVAPPAPAKPAPSTWLADRKRSGVLPEKLPKALKPLDEPDHYLHERSGIVLVHVPKGRFQMGNILGDNSAEKPQHWVDLSDYWIGEFEVTNKQFRAFLAADPGYVPTARDGRQGYVFVIDDRSIDADLAGGASKPRYRSIAGADLDHPAGPLGYSTAALDDHPVVQVSKLDAEAFCAWATQDLADGWSMALPTEAQWEKAAAWDPQARHATQYPWGDDFSKGRAKLPSAGKDLTGDDPDDDPRVPPTRPVGSFDDGSAYGVRDLAGNVWEWCRDPYLRTAFEEAQKSLAIDPLTSWRSSDPPKFTVRGGSFNSGEAYRTTHRRDRRVFDHHTALDLGFRVVVKRLP